MAFPTSPVNGQIAVVANISYVYNSTVRSWTRLPAANVSLGNLTANGSVYSSGGYYWSNGQPYSGAAFSTVAVTGQNNVIANTASAVLNVTGSGGVRILTDATSDTVEVTTSIDSGDYGLITDTATVTSNLGLVTEVISSTAEYGNVNALIIGTIDGSTIWSNSIPGTRLIPGTDINVGGITANTITASSAIITTLQVLGAFNANLTTSNLVVGSNLTVAGNRARITGDFSNVTVNSRLMFQTNVVNSSTGIYALPAGTSTAASWQATNNSDPTNCAKILIATNGTTDVQLVSGINGTGSYLPLSFYMSGFPAMQIATSGNVTLANSAVINGLATIVGNVTMSSNVTISRSLGVGTAIAGNVGEIRATNYITAFYSDQRLKSNIEPITGALDRVKKLAGIFYTQNSTAEQYGYNDYSQQVGLFAQDVQQVLPQAVKPAPFDIGPGGTSISGQNYLTIQYEKMVPLLVEAIKELSDIVDQLKGQ